MWRITIHKLQLLSQGLWKWGLPDLFRDCRVLIAPAVRLLEDADYEGALKFVVGNRAGYAEFFGITIKRVELEAIRPYERRPFESMMPCGGQFSFSPSKLSQWSRARLVVARFCVIGALCCWTGEWSFWGRISSLRAGICEKDSRNGEG